MASRFLLIASITCVLFTITENSGSARNRLILQTDTLKTFEVSVKEVEECSKLGCMQNMMIKAKALKSFLLVYKSGSIWITEKNTTKAKELIDKLHFNRIALGTGNILLNKIPVKQKYLVILDDK